MLEAPCDWSLLFVATVIGAAATEQWLLDPEGQGAVHRTGEVQASSQALNNFRTCRCFFQKLNTDINFSLYINAFSILNIIIRHSLIIFVVKPPQHFCIHYDCWTCAHQWCLSVNKPDCLWSFHTVLGTVNKLAVLALVFAWVKANRINSYLLPSLWPINRCRIWLYFT